MISLIHDINQLTRKIDIIEQDIKNTTKKIINDYKSISLDMNQSQSYFLSGVQSRMPAKSYLLTHKGIEVLGEEVIDIEEFINEVITFANNPKRKIEVLSDLVTHLDKINDALKNNKKRENREVLNQNQYPNK
ncbi:MAG: hypothetical protein ACPKPY_00490 [Nitrososphaeraceae archaeon]